MTMLDGNELLSQLDDWSEQDILADLEADFMEDHAWLGFLGEAYYRNHLDER